MSKEAQVFFQSSDHDRFQLFGIDIDSTRKALWVQDLQRVANELEWPLCGVAERNSRCSNSAAISRTYRVN